MYMTVGRKGNHMPSEEHAKMQRTWTERLAFRSNAAGTPKCDNSILECKTHTLACRGREVWCCNSSTGLACSHSLSTINSRARPHLLSHQNHTSSPQRTQKKDSRPWRIKRQVGGGKCGCGQEGQGQLSSLEWLDTVPSSRSRECISEHRAQVTLTPKTVHPE